MATLVLLTVITLFASVGVAGWRPITCLDAACDKTEDSPLPAAISQVVASDDPLFYALTGIGLVGLVASFHGILIAGSRAMLEFGRARYLPEVVGNVHPKTRTPVVALVANMGIGFIALLTGKTEDIINLSVLGALTLYIVSSAAVLLLRRTEPALERPYRTPGYPVTPIAALVIAVVCLAAMVWTNPITSLVYAGCLGAG